jgi:hypothetical protein
VFRLNLLINNLSGNLPADRKVPSLKDKLEWGGVLDEEAAKRLAKESLLK